MTATEHTSAGFPSKLIDNIAAELQLGNAQIFRLSHDISALFLADHMMIVDIFVPPYYISRF